MLERNELFALRDAVLRELRRAGISQWDESYPDDATLAADLASGNAWGMHLNGRLVAFACVDAEQNPEYATMPWHWNHGPVAVIHRLMVDPQHWGTGMASGLMRAIEAELAARGVGAIRLDAYTDNPRANRLYLRLGYTSPGCLEFRTGRFTCYEKRLAGVAATVTPPASSPRVLRP